MEFLDIEPYSDAQVPEAIERVVNHPLFPRLVKTLNPNIDVATLQHMFRTITTTEQLQHFIMQPLLMHIANSSMTSFTSSGFEQLDRNRRYLFVSNHRDIFLDAAMLDVLLIQRGMETPEIGFGNNLIRNDFIKDIFRLNKLFTILRGGTRREFYENSLLHSRYIRYARMERNHSVWIAQRNGRTKNGDDHTDPALLKMFAMSGTGDFVEDMDALQIVPVAVSYEYEPCDALKVMETYISSTGVYEKGRNEDMNSIMTGIMQPKGDVHITLCPPIKRSEIEACAQHEKNDRFAALAQIIDQRIYAGYKLHTTNYIAYDLLHESTLCEERYTMEQMESFINYMCQHTDRWPSAGARERLRELMLQLYAAPVRLVPLQHD